MMILKRSEMGKNYGVVMLPEGLIEFIPEFNALISDINDVLASGIPTTIGERKRQRNIFKTARAGTVIRRFGMHVLGQFIRSVVSTFPATLRLEIPSRGRANMVVSRGMVFAFVGINRLFEEKSLHD